MKAWGLSDGSAGMEAQIKALALALNVPLELKKIKLKGWANKLPSELLVWFAPWLLSHVIDRTSDALESPPELVISCGRRGALAALALRKRYPQPRYINIQDPHVSPKHFDLVIAMSHDKVSGDNVIKTRFALHSITPARLAEARSHFAERFSAFERPLVAVLLGGSTNKYELTPEAMAQVILKLQNFQKRSDASLLITPSRRTGAENIAMLTQTFASNPRVDVYDFASENPYLGLLALADAIVVSNDSVGMMTDAYATGKPVYLLPLPGHSGTKPAAFAQDLLTSGIAHLIDSPFHSWCYLVTDDMAALAQQIKLRLHL